MNRLVEFNMIGGTELRGWKSRMPVARVAFTIQKDTNIIWVCLILFEHIYIYIHNYIYT